MTATARKLALLVYRMLKYNIPYHHTSAAEYDKRPRTRILRGLRKRATSLGFELVEASTGLVVGSQFLRSAFARSLLLKRLGPTDRGY